MQLLWLLIFFAVLIWSAINPHDYPTWILEASPALIALLVMAMTRRTFPLTPLLYMLILLHSILLMVGAHYTYAEVPLFDWISEMLGHIRNNFDKLGHFMQGFVPAIAAREILIRKEVVNGRGWLNVIVVAVSLAISAFYELLEWLTAEIMGGGAEAFLGTQGYVWDTQSDMALALLGAVAALVLLGRIHDDQLRKLLPSHQAGIRK
jgi:putative membrane protein